MQCTIPSDRPPLDRMDHGTRPRVAIVGGGPAGLMTARLLEQQRAAPWTITLFEASGRLGGKLYTCRFDAAPVMYEAGVAECYDYQAIGPDPLRALIGELGLKIVPNHSTGIMLNGALIQDDGEIRRCFGERTLKTIQEFRRRASRMVPLASWYRGFGVEDNHHPWAHRTMDEILDELPDPIARKYFKVGAHSDMATEPHLVSGLIGLRNVLKSVPGYGAQYSIEGGMEMLSRRLAECLASTRVERGARVVRVSRSGDSFAIRVRRGDGFVDQHFDAVVLALPYHHLPSIDMAGERLRRAMTAHVAHYDSPGHYLRISILFRQPFWGQLIAGPWIMLDAFGGCCLYNESARHDTGGHGVLSWLLAGADALSLCKADDGTLVERAIEALPRELHGTAFEQFIEAKVHRWAGALSGQPGGFTLRPPRAAHRPEPIEHPGLVVVGDYLFDSTLNGVLRSASIATDLLAEAITGRTASPTSPAEERAEFACVP
jgi:protoporphyrinogen oxidase